MLSILPIYRIVVYHRLLTLYRLHGIKEAQAHLSLLAEIDEGLTAVAQLLLWGTQFTGKEYDAETGLYYFGARYYDPRVSTWVSPDDRINQKELSKATNLYMYVLGNPVRYKDPNGHEPHYDDFIWQWLENLPHFWNLATSEESSVITIGRRSELTGPVGYSVFAGIAAEINIWGMVSSNRVFNDVRLMATYNRTVGVNAIPRTTEFGIYPNMKMPEFMDSSYLTMSGSIGPVGLAYSRDDKGVKGYSISIGSGAGASILLGGDHAFSKFSPNLIPQAASATAAPSTPSASGGAPSIGRSSPASSGRGGGSSGLSFGGGGGGQRPIGPFQESGKF